MRKSVMSPSEYLEAIRKGKPKRKREPVPLPDLGSGVQLLSLDVSSVAVGVAIVSRASRASSPVVLDLAKFRAPKSWPDTRRIDELLDQFVAWCDWAYWPRRCTAAVMEWSSGHTGHALRARGANATGLVKVGQAQGAFRRAIQCSGARLDAFDCVPEWQWTRGRAKGDRAKLLGLRFPEYAGFLLERNDEGLDVADALELGVWRLSR